MKFSIAIVQPDGYRFSECFQEIAETLVYGLRALGHEADAGFNRIRYDARHIVLGAHLLPHNAELPYGTIIYNLEQISATGMESLRALASRYQLWDYSRLNVEKWRGMGIDAKHVPIGYVPELTRIKQAEHDLDVLFYGSVNDRRRKIVHGLMDAGLYVAAPFGLFGYARDCLIARAKVVLNVHYYPSKIFEIVRISYLLSNSKAVVTESSRDEADYFDLYGATVSVPYESLVETCVRLVTEGSNRPQYEADSLQMFSKRDEREYLRAALQ